MKIPTSRLMDRLNLRSLYREAPLSLKRYEPDEVTLKLQQHIGAPAEPIVKVGEVHKKGSILSCGRLKVSQFLVLGGIRLRGMEGSARL